MIVQTVRPGSKAKKPVFCLGQEQHMREKIKTFFCILFLACALPYIITLCFQGKEGKEAFLPMADSNPSTEGSNEEKEGKEEKPDVQESEQEHSSENKEQPDAQAEEGGAESKETSDAQAGEGGAESKETSDAQAEEEDEELEEYLAGVVAAQMPLEYEMEALKAQAVIARTTLRAAQEQGTEPPQSLNKEELLKLWGEEGYLENYQKAMEAVAATREIVITYEGAYPYAAFHAVSAGKTRSAAEALGNEQMPWLAGTDSMQDIPAEDYLKVTFFDKKDFARRLITVFGDITVSDENPLQDLELTARDSAEYVTKVTCQGQEVTGEEFRSALELPSACLYLKEVEGKIRIVTKGLGHGLGMSQYGANAMAKQGSSFQEILKTYFKNIEISD